MKTRLSNWREDTDLLEAITGKMTDKEALKKVDEKKGINNKVTINPKLSEAVKELGGEVLSIDERVGGAGTLVRQGVKYGGKKGGRAVQAGQKVAIAKGQSVKASAAKGNVKKMIGTGRAEKAGALVGGLAGAVGGGILDGPVVPVGDIVGGIVGSKVGGKLGRQIDKGGSALKKAITKEETENVDEGIVTGGLAAAAIGGAALSLAKPYLKKLVDKKLKSATKAGSIGGIKVGGSASRMGSISTGPLNTEAASYETVKKGEVLGALKRDNKGRKKPLSVADRDKIADKVVKDKGDTSKSDDRYAYEEFEAVVEYFYAEGINEEGLDLIIEEVGLDNFVDFVDDSVELLTEERAARKMNVRTLKATQKKAEEIKASKKDVVKRGTPADTLARARTERSFKKPKLAKPSPKKEAPAPAPTKAKKAATVIKKARKATVAKARKDFDGDGKVETPKSEHRGVRNKKITKAVAKAKPAQPKKPASKEGLRAKIKSAYEAGVKRHRKATQPVRVFHKGMKAGAKKTVKFAKDVKKAVVGEKFDYDPMDDPDFDPREAEKKRGVSGKNNPKGGKKLKDLTKEGFSNWREELVLEGKCDDCSCKGCGQNPCVECGEDHHKLDEAKVTRLGDAQQKAMQDAVLKRKEELAQQGKKKKREAWAKKISKKKYSSKTHISASELKKADLDGDGKVRVIDAGYEPEGQMVEAKADTGTAAEKASARNKRNTPAGKDYKFDTSVFITRKPGESLDSARTRKRREAHAKKRGVKEEVIGIQQEGYKKLPVAKMASKISKKQFKAGQSRDVKTISKKSTETGKMISVLDTHDPERSKSKSKIKEDKAYDNVVGALRKKHGKDAVLTKDSPKPKAQPRPKAKPQKPLTDKEKAHREVIARYGGEENYKAGRGLGT